MKKKKVDLGELEKESVKLTRWGERDYPMEELGDTIPADDHGDGSFDGALWESGELLKLISENTTDRIWLLDMDWNIIWMTPSVERVSGFTFDEIKAKSIEQMLTPRSLEQVREVAARELTPERLADPGAEISTRLELELLRKDGSAVLEEVTLTLIRDSDGKPAGYIGVGRDITERKATEDGLRESEELFRLHFEKSYDVIYSQDLEFRLLNVSPAVERFLGYRPEELIGRSFVELDIIAPECLEAAVTDSLRVQSGKRMSPVQYVFIARDGTRKYGEITASRLVKDGEAVGFVGILRDITERKKAEDALRESQQKYQLIVDWMSDLVWTVDTSLNVTFSSPSVERLLGYTAEEFSQMTIDAYIAPESQGVVLQRLAEELESDKQVADPDRAIILEVDYIHRNGSIIRMEVNTNFVRDADGKPVGLVGVSRDITERKLAEDALHKNQQKYQLIVDWMNDMVWTADTSLNITFCSPSVERLLGYTVEELSRMTIDAYITPESMEYVWQEFAKELERDKQGADPDREMILEVDHIHKDGSIVRVEINTNFVRGEDGKHVGLVGVSRDITERRKAEEALRQSEERFRRLFEDSPLGMSIIGLDFRFQRANRALCEMTGYSMEELSELTFPDITHLDDVEDLVDKAVRMRAGQISLLSEECRVNRKDDGFIWMSVTASLMRDENGDPAYAIAMCEDITARKQMERDRKRLNEELEWRVRERTSQLDSANKELEAFCYSVSHDLSTPLRAIDGFSRMVLDESSTTLDAEARRRLETILQNTDHMNNLINGVLDFSRLGRREVKPSEIDMRKLAGEVFDELAVPLEERHIDFRLAALPPASGDRLLIRLLLANLLANAIKFSSREEVPVIEVGGEAEEGKNIYWVKDSGAGFDMHYADKLFAVFGRLHSTEDFEGIGMGLANVQRIINKHGGRVWAEGREGEGATFYFTLPAAPGKTE